MARRSPIIGHSPLILLRLPPPAAVDDDDQFECAEFLLCCDLCVISNNQGDNKMYAVVFMQFPPPFLVCVESAARDGRRLHARFYCTSTSCC
jgi:hypothetical protein